MQGRSSQEERVIPAYLAKFNSDAEYPPESLLRDSQLQGGERVQSADSVEKLGRSGERRAAAKIDLSDRPRIDDRDPGNGLTTPANVRKRDRSSFSTESARRCLW